SLRHVPLLPGEAIGHASSRIDGPSSAKPVIAGLRATLSFDSAAGRSSRLTTDFPDDFLTTDFTDGTDGGGRWEREEGRGEMGRLRDYQTTGLLDCGTA